MNNYNSYVNPIIMIECYIFFRGLQSVVRSARPEWWGQRGQCGEAREARVMRPTRAVWWGQRGQCGEANEGSVVRPARPEWCDQRGHFRSGQRGAVTADSESGCVSVRSFTSSLEGRARIIPPELPELSERLHSNSTGKFPAPQEFPIFPSF